MLLLGVLCLATIAAFPLYIIPITNDIPLAVVLTVMFFIALNGVKWVNTSLGWFHSNRERHEST